jgi:hypothetical protein
VSELVIPILSDLVTKINEEHQQSLDDCKSALEHARKAGELLQQAKEQLRHGRYTHHCFTEREDLAVPQVALRERRLQT